MMRNLKIGMAIAAVLAMSAIGAAAAQAGSLDVGAAPAWLTGSQVAGTGRHKWTVTSSSGVTLTTIKCETETLQITTSTSSVTELTATPSYGAAGTCEEGGLAATVTPGTCQFTLSGVGTAALTFNVSIANCTSTLTVAQGTCVLSVPSTSTTLEKVTAESVAGTPDHITLTMAIGKIPITGGSGCSANLQAAGNTVDTNGLITTKAFSDVSGVEGSQVSLTAT